MSDKQRDGYDTWDIIIKIVATIAIPWAIFCYTAESTQAKLSIEESTQQGERELKILSLLASNNSKELRIATLYATHLVENKLIHPVFKDIALNAYPSQPAGNVAEGRLVYVHIADETQRTKAVALQQELRKQGFIVPGIENVGDDKGRKATSPSAFEIRYFISDDKTHAEEINKTIATALNMTATPTLISGYNRTLPIEVWFPATN